MNPSTPDDCAGPKVIDLMKALTNSLNQCPPATDSPAEREEERLADLRMAWTIGACFGKEHHRWTADQYRRFSLAMTANECLDLTPDGQSSRVPEGQ